MADEEKKLTDQFNILFDDITEDLNESSDTLSKKAEEAVTGTKEAVEATASETAKAASEAANEADDLFNEVDHAFANTEEAFSEVKEDASEAVKEVSEKVGISLPTATAEKVSSDAESKVKKEIDALIGRISAKVKAENVRLRERILFLEGENRRLRERAFADRNGKLIKYFGRGGTHFPPDGYGLN